MMGIEDLCLFWQLQMSFFEVQKSVFKSKYRTESSKCNKSAGRANN